MAESAPKMNHAEGVKNSDVSDKSTNKENRTRDRKRSRSRSKNRHSKKDSKRRKESSDSRRRHNRRSRSRSRDRRSRRHRSRDRTKHRRRSSSSSSSSNDSDKNEPTEQSTTGKEGNKVADKSEDNLKKDRGKRSDDKGHTRSRDRRPKRSRSPDRRRRRSRERRRSKSRDRKSSRRTSHEKEVTTKPKDPDMESQKPSKNMPSDEFGQEKLEEEMKKRRDRVEMWRMEQKLALRKAGQEERDGGGESDAPRKAWTLDDDDDSDENNDNSSEKDKEEEEEEEETKDVPKIDEEKEDEVDPLDAFMQNLGTESNENVLEKNNVKTDSNGGPKISRVVAVAKKVKVEPDNTPKKHKGELMEANADAMEYSSEEEEESLDTAFSKFQNKQKNKKLDTVVDHEAIEYEDFNRKFYVEVPEIAAMTEEEVADYRAELENVKVRGKNCPKPIKSWAQAGVSFKVLNALKKAKFEKPTSIQAQALPAIMSGYDLIGIAKTGSGKTLAFLLPMFRHIMDQRPLDDAEGPIALVMTPTRELALQITKECKKFTKSLRLQVVCVYGGTGISEQIAELKRGAEIIICTPGRMIDMLAANNGRVTNMRRCTYMVLDEADRMFDMGFEPQVKSIINSCRPDRQTVVFSATFPRHMEALARRILTRPIEVQVGGRSIVCSDVTQNVVILGREQKFLKLLELLGSYQEQGSVLVFVDKQEHADSLLKDLMDSSYPCMALHGGIDQYDRDSVINDFKSGASTLLVATSVAARGLDVRNLILVVNYDCPNHYEDYVHRCGRTGRAGNTGFAYTFLTNDQARYAGDIIRALELSESPVPSALENLWTTYKMELKSQGKEVSKNKGFVGRGFKFDETEDEMVRERKQFQKAALGLHDSDDDSPSKDIDEQIENMFNSKKRVKDVTGPVLVPGVGGAQASANTNTNTQKLEVARRLASQINIKKNLGAEAQDVTQQTASAIMKGGPFQAPRVSAKTIAEQLAEKLNQKLNYVPQEKPEEEDPSAGMKRYEEELEINDFPQTCRWKVTSKETLLQISEYSEAGITIRGQYYTNGKQPEEDERKLYLAIEATTEIAVQKAKSEITRLIKEELIRLQNSYQPASKSRYKIT